MAILKIAKMGDPALRTRAQEVEDPTAPPIHGLIRDMVETMVDAGGAGLAAPQVHVPLRIVIFRQPTENATEDETGDETEDEAADETTDDSAAEEDAAEDKRGPLTILINPVVEPQGDEMIADWEGCLSVPDMQGIVPRYASIRYSGVGPDGEKIEREAQGFHARVVQHECDHLDGILYPQRMADLRLLGFTDELERHPLEFAPEDDEQRDAGDGAADAAETVDVVETADAAGVPDSEGGGASGA